MNSNEFQMHAPLPRRGLTSVEAVHLMKREFPEVEIWTCWRPGAMAYSGALMKFAGEGYRQEGEIAGWHWRRLLTSYPASVYFDGRISPQGLADCWTGVIEVLGPSGEKFLLFSFLTSAGDIGSALLASTPDVRLLERFGREVAAALSSGADLVPITVFGGLDIRLSPADEPLFLLDGLVQDIEAQVVSFFEDEALFKQLNLRRRRGLLFVGQPGNGKTLMVRNLARLAYRKYRAPLFSLNIRRNTDGDDLNIIFASAAEEGPSVVILEDLDSLTRESAVTRAGLLSLLDGLDPREGVLVLATTNNPEEIDPAFVQRPSRFDRVWNFGLPDGDLRQKYIDWSFEALPESVRARLAANTGGWSFAFLNELRVSAAILALRGGRDQVTELDALAAYELLATQFKAGRQGYQVPDEERVGFMRKK